MKNKGLLIFLGILGLLFFWGCNTQRGLVSFDEGINQKWGDVQNQYQRRLDLIDNLVNTVKGEANFEKSTLESVIQARASATAIKVDPSDLSPEKLAEFQKSQSGLSQALGRLMVVTENYPNLKTNASFLKLQDEISGTENRIAKARDEYNASVRPYNTKVRQLPGSLIAGLLGFKVRGSFEADPEAKKAPKVNFENGSSSAPSGNSSSAPTGNSSAPKK
jgi:LemA protein